METKYTKEELTELAKGVFCDDKTSPSIYANEEGTFRNSVQYDALPNKSEDGKPGKDSFLFEFKNPNVKAVDQSTTILIDGQEITIAQIKESYAQLESELIEANEKLRSTSVNPEKEAALQAQLDAANAEIERLNGLKTISVAKDLQAQLDAANAKIAELTVPKPALTPAP